MEENHKRGFSTLFIILSALTILSVLAISFFSFRYFVIYNNFEKSVEEKALGQVERGVSSFYSYFQNLKATVDSLGEHLDSTPYDLTTLSNLLKSKLEENKLIASLGVAFKPYFFPAKKLSYLFFYRSENSILPLNIPYDYSISSEEASAVTDWYSKAMENATAWVGPYWAMALQDHIIVYSKRIYSPSDVKMKNPIGVLTGVLGLNYIQEKIKSLSLGKLGYGFIITETGQYIAHPSKEHYLEEKTLVQDVIKLHAKDTAQEIGMWEYYNEITGQKSILIYKNIPQTKLVLCAVMIKDKSLSEFSKEFTLNRIFLICSIVAFFILLTVLFFRIIFRLDGDEDL